MILRPLSLLPMVSLLLAVVLPQRAWPAGGDAPTAEVEATEALRFRRVYAPADREKDWPLGKVKYMPVEPAEFERLLKAAQTTSSDARTLVSARPVAAQYQARLVGGQLAAGRGTLQVIRSAEAPTLLPLDPCGLAIGEATWAGDPARAAMLGLGVDGKLQLLVETSGQLNFQWSLAGRRDPDGAVDFQFDLPACPSNRLILELPGRMTPVADHGVLLREDWVDEEVRRWEFELGGHHRFGLRVLPAGTAARRRQLALVRESVEYHFSQRGLDVEAELKFEVHNGPLRQVTLAQDPQLQLVSAQCGGTTVPWSVISASGSTATRIVLTLPGPMRGTERVLRLRALAPLKLDRRWRLPRIRPAEVFWQEGVATLMVPAPLVLNRLVPIGCRQTGTGSLSGSRRGESAQFQYFTPNATVEVILAQRSAPVQLASGTAVELSDRGMTARVVGDFSISEDSRFLLEADVSRRWLIDSVESQPAEAMDDWDLGRPSGRRRKLTVRLAKALSPTQPVKLVVNARRLLSPLGRTLGIDGLVPLRFDGPEGSQRLVAVRAVGPYQLAVTGAEQFNRINPRSLTAAQQALFVLPSGGSVFVAPDERRGELLFENNSAAAGLQIALESQRPTYSATLQVEATVSDKTLREDYVLRCVPESSRVDRLLVHFSHRRDVPLHWTVGAGEGQQLAARRLTLDELAAARLGPDQEAWELTLRCPRSEAFEVRGTREIELAGQEPISLVSLPKATGQRARLVVRSSGSKALRIDNQRLRRIPAETIPRQRYQTARGTYRYDPSRDLVGPPDAAVTVSISGGPAMPPAWIWSCQLESRYEANGAGRHLATYRLESSGGAALRMDLPPTVETRDVHDVWVDQDRVAVHRLTGRRAGRLTIDLPRDEKFSTVSIHFSTPPRRLGTLGSLAPPLPDVDLPILSRHWTVRLPPGYEAVDGGPGWRPPAASQSSWSQRLLGPLGRAAGQRPFDPLAAEEWSGIGSETREKTSAPVEAGQSEPAGPEAPWTPARLAGWEPADAPGRNTCWLDISGTSPVRLKFVHRRTMRLFGWLTFLVVVALGWWLARGRPQLLTLLLGGFGFAALVLPETYVPVASGAVLGTCFCLAYGLIRRPIAAERLPADADGKPDPPGAVSVATSAGVMMFVAAALGGVCAAAGGEPPEPKSPPRAPPVHRVFIPIDQNGQPTGGKYFVPEQFYVQLHRRADVATEKPHGWLITAATYRGVLARETTSERLVVEELKADYALRVFEPVARVRIPLRRRQANLLFEGALLDSRVIQPEWEPDGSGLLVEVPQPGEYRLELSLRPTLRSDGAATGFELGTAALATSRLELTLPPGAPAVEVPNAVGSTRLDGQPPRLVAELGPSDRLTVRWPDGAGRAADTPAVDVEELLWLKVRPGSVVVDAKFKFKIAQGQVRQLQLVTDPRLRLLPLQGDDPPEVEVRRTPGQPQIVNLQWPAPVSDEVLVSPTFMLMGASGVGNLRLPKLSSLDARSTRRWLAVSVDPELKHQEQPSEGLEPVAVPDFLSAWGQAESQPRLAYRLPSGETAWSMSTRLCEPRTTVEQRLALSFDGQGAEVHFDADLVPAAGYVFQHRLTVPAGLQVEQVSVLEEDVERAARWSLDGEGTITVFLTELMAGPQKLSLRGRLPTLPRQRQMPLPRIEVDGGQVKSSTVELFRRPPVMVSVDAANGLIEDEAPPVESRDPELGRPVRRLRAQGGKPIKATLTIEPNRPKVKAEQLTWLRCDGGSWEAQLDCRIRVANGVVDQVRIDVPGLLSGPYEVDPPATLEMVDRPGQNRQLVVRPPAAIDAEYRFRISSPLALTPGDRPSAPQIMLRQVDRLRRFLALPRRADGRPIDWETQGLEEAEPPDGFAVPPDAETFVVYEITGEAWQAVVRAPSQAPEAVRVRLADVQIAWQADRSCRGVATFDLEPDSLSEVPLWLPSGYDLVHVSVAGVPTEPIPTAPASADTGVHSSVYRVPLGPARLPQRIVVVFSGVLPEPGSAAGRRLEAPSLGELPVEETLWTVAGPSALVPGAPEDGSLISPWSQELLRLKTAAALVESGLAVSAEAPDAIPPWYRRWAGRLAAARATLERQAAPTGQAEETSEEILAIDNRQVQIAERLGMTDVYRRLKRSGPLVADDPADLWQQTLGPGQAATRSRFPEAAGSITLAYHRAEPNPLAYRLAGGAVLVVLAILAVLGLRRGTLAEPFRRWPQAIGVAAGLAWWLWLWPSVLGWGIVLVSLLSSLRSGWKPRPPAPSIVSLQTRQRLPG